MDILQFISQLFGKVDNVAKNAANMTAARSYAKLNALRGLSPEQISNWVDGNVTNLAQAQDAIKTLAIAVSVLARRL